MPDELDEIRRRLDVLESRMDSESSLRAMMDLDQATLTARLDAQDNLLHALAITQSDHTRRLTRLEDGQQRLEGTVGRLEGRVDSLQGAVARVEVGLQTIITLLSNDHGA
jgi:predicted  nucleic acid-binding Zn-ribbon protein